MRKSSTSEFTEKAINVHGNVYDYSLVEYKNAYTKIKIKCSIHGIFEQTPTNHLQGQTCPKCCGKFLTKNEILQKIFEIHKDKYDYSLMDYNRKKNKITIICKEHGAFQQKLQKHISGCGCPKCGKSKKLTIDEFIYLSNIAHNNKYDYSDSVYINAKIKIKIKCPNHGTFEQAADHHINGVGCPICSESHGEKGIRIFLLSKNIEYIQNKRFNECKSKNPLPFDFYLPKYDICIEYDGIQHFKEIEYWKGRDTLAKRKLRDQIKTDFCLKNGIKLIRIKYNENIEEKLKIVFI